MNPLITGATGFIGSHLARHLVRAGHHVVGLEVSPTLARVTDLEGRMTLVTGDISDLDLLVNTIKTHEITHVVHLACYLPEALIQDHPTKAVQVNCQGTNNVFEAARRTDVQKVVYASTDAVCPQGPGEADAVQPTTLYGLMKYFNECMGRHYCTHFGVETIGLRFGVNYGPGGRHLAGEIQRQYSSAFLHQILERMMLGESVVVDFHPQTPFTWQYVKDNARCVALALQSKPTGRHVFDVPGQRRPIKALTDILENTIPGAKASYETIAEDDQRLIVLDPPYTVDPTTVKEAFGYEPGYTLETGLAEQAGEVQDSPQLYRQD